MTLAEEFEAAGKEMRECYEMNESLLCSNRIDAGLLIWAELFDRAAELARDNERVVQSIVARDVP